MPADHPEAWRPLFPLGFVTATAALVVWAGALAGVGPPVDPTLHAKVMLYGAWGSGVMGFLLTAFPRQNGHPGPSRRQLLALVATQAAADVLSLAAMMGASTLEPAGALRTLAWLGTLALAADIAVPSLRRAPDPQPAAVMVGVGALGVGCAWSHLGGARAGLQLAAWGGLMVIGIAFLDRVLPFFTSRAAPTATPVRHRALLPALAVLGPAIGILPDPLAGMSAMALAAVLARSALGWSPSASLRVGMLGVLHLGVAWILAALLARAWSGLISDLGTTPTHLLLLGGFGTLLLGLSMRVALGHSGGVIALRPVGALATGLLQLAALLRTAGPLWTWPWAAALAAVAAALWLVDFGPRARQRG